MSGAEPLPIQATQPDLLAASAPMDAGDASADGASAAPRRRLPVRLAARVPLDVAFLLLLSICLYLPGFLTLPTTDRDEARFVQSTRQMVETGDYVDIRLQDEPRYKKPIGVYWLQAASIALSGQGVDAALWVYRLPSLAGVVLAVFATYWVGLRFGGPNAGLVAAALLAAAVVTGVEARLAKSDGVLLACVTVAQAALALAWMERRDRRRVLALLFWTAVGLGVLVKGPIILLVVGTTVVVLAVVDRSLAFFRQLSPVAGVIWTGLLVLPWVAAIWSVAGASFFAEAIGEDLLGKVATGTEGHGAPPGTYLLALFGLFWPGSAFLALALPWIWRHRRDRRLVFLLAWALPSWIVFELVATKLPHYVLPLFPALALMTGLAFSQGGVTLDRRWRIAVLLLVPLGALILAGGFNAGFVWLERHASGGGLILGVVGAVIALLAFRRGLDRRPTAALVLALLSAVALYAAVWGAMLPYATRLWASDRLAEAVTAHQPCADPLVVSVGYAEPSLVFLLGTDTRLDEAAEAARAFAGASCAVALVTAENRAEFEIGAGGGAPVATVRATNLNGLELVDFLVYVRGEGALP